MKEKSKILLVDDEQDILTLYKAKLSKVGYEIMTAKDGKECMDTARSFKPDLVLMDMKMPVMDGVNTQKAMYKDHELHGVPVVFLTAFSDPMKLEIDKDTLVGDGVLGVIKKGVSLEEIVSEVEKFLAM